MKLKTLAEARKNWDHPAQQKVYGADKLRQYANDDNIYISFTEIDKLGINPQSGYQTPIGIYTYPLKQVFGEMDKSHSVQEVPFAGKQPFIWICKPRVEVMELSNYRPSDLSSDIEKIKSYAIKIKHMEPQQAIDFIQEAIANARGVANMDASKMWNITRTLARNPTEWNYILRTVLGYGAISDKTGMGLIHPSEKVQAVFLSKNALQIIDKLRNNETRLEFYKLKRLDKSGKIKRNPTIMNHIYRKTLGEDIHYATQTLESFEHAIRHYPVVALQRFRPVIECLQIHEEYYEKFPKEVENIGKLIKSIASILKPKLEELKRQNQNIPSDDLMARINTYTDFLNQVSHSSLA